MALTAEQRAELERLRAKFPEQAKAPSRPLAEMESPTFEGVPTAAPDTRQVIPEQVIPQFGANPMEGVPLLQRAAEGTGQGVMQAYRGVRGLLPGSPYTPERLAEQAAIDAPLMADPAGFLGSVAGQAAPGLAGGYLLGRVPAVSRLTSLFPVSAPAAAASMEAAATTPGDVSSRALAAALAALGGTVVGNVAGGASGVLDPQLDAKVRLLLQEGVPLTVGQMGPRWLHRFESGLTSVPFTGDAVIAARNQSIEGLNRAAYERALRPIREAMPQPPAPGGALVPVPGAPAAGAAVPPAALPSGGVPTLPSPESMRAVALPAPADVPRIGSNLPAVPGGPPAVVPPRGPQWTVSDAPAAETLGARAPGAAPEVVPDVTPPRGPRPGLPNAADMPVGYEGVAQLYEALGAQYDDVLDRIGTIPVDSSAVRAIERARQGAATMHPDQAAQFRAIIDNDVLRRMQSGEITAESMKELESKLSSKMRSYIGAPNPDQRDLGLAIESLQDSLRELVERQAPAEDAVLMRGINAGYREFKTVSSAAAALGAKGGVFSPSQLKGASKRSTSELRFSTNRGTMQDLATAAEAVLPSSVADSGTPFRAMMAAGGLGTGFFSPKALAAMLGGAAAYSSPSQSLIRALVTTQRPLPLRATAEALRRNQAALTYLSGLGASSLADGP